MDNQNHKNDSISEQTDDFSEFENDNYIEDENHTLYTDEILNSWASDSKESETIKKTSHPLKTLSTAEQFKVMIVFLIAACLVFTIVYILSPHNTEPTNTNPTDTSNISTSTEEPSVSESSLSLPESKAEESEISTSESPAESMAYNYITKSGEETHYGNLILVNQYYHCWADGEDTVSIYENKTNTYIVVNAVTMLNESIIEPLNNLMDDFYEAYGVTDIMVTSAYRSYNTQVSLFNREIEIRGSEEAAAQWVARPGYSEHQTGLAFDLDLNQTTSSGGIDYTGTGIYKWINEHCQNYGFVVRYADDKQDITGIVYEPWHFRYVGIPHATYMVDNNLCLEEYIELLHTHTKDNPLKIASESKTWYVYSVSINSETAQVPVPADREYTISGDNCGHFIICYEDIHP